MRPYFSVIGNAYQIGHKKVRLKVGIDLEATETRLIRRTDATPVVTADLDLVTMRWGFEQEGFGTINNTRKDKLTGPMWGRAFDSNDERTHSPRVRHSRAMCD